FIAHSLGLGVEALHLEISVVVVVVVVSHRRVPRPSSQTRRAIFRASSAAPSPQTGRHRYRRHDDPITLAHNRRPRPPMRPHPADGWSCRGSLALTLERLHHNPAHIAGNRPILARRSGLKFRLELRINRHTQLRATILTH